MELYHTNIKTRLTDMVLYVGFSATTAYEIMGVSIDIEFVDKFLYAIFMLGMIILTGIKIYKSIKK